MIGKTKVWKLTQGALKEILRVFRARKGVGSDAIAKYRDIEREDSAILLDKLTVREFHPLTEIFAWLGIRFEFVILKQRWKQVDEEVLTARVQFVCVKEPEHPRQWD
jgi:hypothetical protein